jgi:hypothetical protein
MKKAVIVFWGMCFSFFNIFAYELIGTYNGFFDGNAPYATSSFVFRENTYEAIIFFEEIPSILDETDVIYENGGWKYAEKGSFRLLNDNNIYYIEWTDSKIFSKYGIIYNEIEMYLFDNNKVVFYPGIGGNMANIFPSITNVKASSELLENTRRYYARNMIDSRGGMPWVEGVNGHGIGENIILTISSFPEFPFKGFIISNGYVNFERPDLYKKNSRIKTIEIISPDGLRIEYSLDDTSLFQTIGLPENMWKTETSWSGSRSEYKIIIKDVYPGDLWDDTCINLIETIVPYLYKK